MSDPLGADLITAERRPHNPVTWELAGCSAEHLSTVMDAVDSIQTRLPEHQHLEVHIQIVSPGRDRSSWRVEWRLGDDADQFQFEGGDCNSLAEASVEMLYSAFPEPIWKDAQPIDDTRSFETASIETRIDDAAPGATETVEPAKARRKRERRTRFRTPQNPKVVAPRTGTISVRGGVMSDFWRPWSQLAVGFDFHFPRNFAVELIGMFNYTRHDLSSDPVQDFRIGGVTRVCNLRRARRNFEIAFCVGVDLLSRRTSRFLAQTDTRIDRDVALELAFSNRTAVIWWVQKWFGLSANLELAGRFFESRLESGTRLRTPRPFRAVFALGAEFSLPRPRPQSI